MHAIRLHAFGPAENLRYEEVADPEPGRGQVRIHVEAAGVHLVDTTIREGRLEGSPIPKPQLPTIPGREVAGVVDALGPDVDAAWLGRRVVAHLGPTGSGGYGELVVCATDRLHVLDGLSAEHAVAMIGTGRTTLAILDLADLRADDVVLVTAAAGGIGSLLVQAARNVGATRGRSCGRRGQGCSRARSGRHAGDRLHPGRLARPGARRAGRPPGQRGI